MFQPTDSAPVCASCYCSRCDVLVGLEGYHVIGVPASGDGKLVVEIESAAGPPPGCPGCGVIAASHGRRDHRLVDIPSFGRPTELIWRKRTWRCAEELCSQWVFTEQDEHLAAPRALLTTRAVWWAARLMRRENASVAGLARQLDTAWATVNDPVIRLLAELDADQARFDGVEVLGVDEHLCAPCEPCQAWPKRVHRHGRSYP